MPTMQARIIHRSIESDWRAVHAFASRPENMPLWASGLAAGLMAACLGRGPNGEPVRKAGVMAVVVRGGDIRAGDPIAVEPPAGVPEALRPV